MRLIILLCAWRAFVPAGAAAAESLTRRPVGPESPGLAWTATTADVPLGFTGQIFGGREGGGFDRDAGAQARQAIANLGKLLHTTGSDLAQTVKLNFCVTEDAWHDPVVGAVSAAFAGHPVPVSFVRSRLGEPGALLAVDAVVQLPSRETAVRLVNVSGFPAVAGGAHLGVLPAGRKVFLSGLASRTKGGFREAVRQVLEGQAKTLRHFGLDPSKIVLVKGWIGPLDHMTEFKAELAAFFGSAPIAPVVLVEWPTANGVEIEFVFAGAKADAARFSAPLAFATRPGAEASTRFSHVAFVDAGQPLIFTAGLYGAAGSPVRQQWQDIYAQLGRLLFDAGSGFRYLVKATYQNANAEGRTVLGEIRDVYYDPARPPAASGVLVHGAGWSGRSATLDMIAVPVPRSSK
ncbi:MAG: RidA family protein [Opitutaceae bacterium]